MRVIRILSFGAAVLLVAGCATKSYVQQEIKTVNERVDTVETQVEATQTKLTDHDAQLAANAQALENASQTAREALDRAIAAGKLAEGKLLYETVLSDDKIKFGFNKAELSDEARAALDEFAAKLAGENKDVYIEVQGHTDSVGAEKYNYELGEARAEAVRRYLSLKGIPLHRMSVISYGEMSPVGDNNSRDGRAQNRRVVLVVLQ
ncbi:MAG TPA: OmpA family protein [Thermoanaerobaculia bacterium]|nr:OmpA family protein [Thermoanaerobaculia bacterium]